MRIPIQTGFICIDFAAIEYCQADGKYTHFYIVDKSLPPGQRKKITSSKNLGWFEVHFEGRCFFRIHDSYITNLDCVKEYRRGEGGQAIMDCGEELPVARKRKAAFLKVWENNLGI